MLNVEEVITHYLVSLLLGVSIAVVLVADQLPVVSIVAVAVIAKARHLLSVADGCVEVGVRVQVFACGVVLQAHLITALDTFSSETSFFRSLRIPHNPQCVLIRFFVLSGRYHLLTRATTVVCVDGQKAVQ